MEPGLELWQQGGNPLLQVTMYITPKARERAFELDRRTVYRRNSYGLEQVAVFKTIQDAFTAVRDHNSIVNEQAFQNIHQKIGHLIERVGSNTMGDPVV